MSTEHILAALADPLATFAEVAEQHGLTVAELAALVARPDIAERLAAMSAAAAQRATLLANLALVAAVRALQSIVEGHEIFERHSAMPLALREKMRQNCLRACNLLLRIARPPRPRPPKAEKTHDPDVARASCPSPSDHDPEPDADNHDDNADNSDAPHPDDPRDYYALPTPGTLYPSPPPEAHESAPEAPAPVRPSPSDPGGADRATDESTPRASAPGISPEHLPSRNPHFSLGLPP